MPIFTPGDDRIPLTTATEKGLKGAAEGLTSAIFTMGNQETDPPVAVLLEMEPGWQLRRHAHTCDRFEVILSGSLVENDGRVLGPGTIMTAQSYEMYGPHVAGPEGCRTIEVFGKQSGVNNPIYDTAAGLEQLDFCTGERRILESLPEVGSTD